jgi:hypothetical protein
VRLTDPTAPDGIASDAAPSDAAAPEPGPEPGDQRQESA